jgi:phage-related holin
MKTWSKVWSEPNKKSSQTVEFAGFFLVEHSGFEPHALSFFLSILKNMTLAGVPFPKRIKDLLGHIKAENDPDSEKAE